MFKNVFLTIDTSDMYDTKSSNGYQLIYEVEEKLVKAGTGNTVFIYFLLLNVYLTSLASHMDPTSGNPSFLSHITFPNILGRGEKLQVSSAKFNFCSSNKKKLVQNWSRMDAI